MLITTIFIFTVGSSQASKWDIFSSPNEEVLKCFKSNNLKESEIKILKNGRPDKKSLRKKAKKVIKSCKSYLGNYTSYLQQRDFELESMRVAYEKQQKDMQVQREYIERFRASATRSTQAKSREKLLHSDHIEEFLPKEVMMPMLP